MTGIQELWGKSRQASSIKHQKVVISRPTYHFKSLQDDGEEYVDENPGACDGKDDEENRRDMGLLFEAPELELVQQHGETRLHGVDGGTELLKLKEIR